MIQEGFLFKYSKLFIPKFSMGDTFIKEKNSGGLSGHFGHAITFSLLNAFYFCPSVQDDVKRLLKGKNNVNMPKEGVIM